MKTLKKTIVVALVLIMALGMLPISGSAEFSDYDEVNYNEAVDVLSGIEVIEGFPEGDFKPKDGVTRAQAAAIITRMVLTRKLADSLPDATTGFPDCDGVSGVGFAIKYIRYCASNGIIVGYPNGNFGPNDPVTAAQFAVMIMRAIGIGETDRYIGDDWQMFAILDGIDNEILDGVADGVDFTKAANREETAQYAFNGLIFSPSGESSEEIFGVLGSHVDANGNTVNDYGWIKTTRVAPDSLAQKVYKTLKKVNKYTDEDGQDDLGRPALVWKYGDPSEVIHRSLAKPDKVWNSGFSEGDLYKYLDNDKITSIPVTLNHAGTQSTATITSLKSKKNSDTSAQPLIYGSPADPSRSRDEDGRGIITELYKVDEDEHYVAVVIKPSFGELKKEDKAATTKVGKHTAYSFSKPTSASGRIFETVVDDEADVDSVVIDGTVADKQYCIYYQGKENLYIEEVDTETYTIKRMSSDEVYTLTDDSTVSKANAYTQIASKDPAVSTDEQELYIDSFGNILGVKESAASAVQLAMVLGFESYAEVVNGKVEYTYMATIIDLDGKVSSVPTTKATYDDNGTYKPIGKVSKFAENSGKYTFSDPGTTDSSTAPTYNINGSVTEIEKGKRDFIGGSLVTMGNNNTKFILVNYIKDPDGDDNSPRISDGTVTPYTGTANVPSFDNLSKTFAVSYNADGKAGSVANIVFIYDDVYAASASSFVYIVGSWVLSADGYAVDVFIEGKADTITVKGVADRNSLVAMAGELWNDIKVNSKGELDLTSALPLEFDSSDPQSAKDSIVNNGGLLELDGDWRYNVEDDVPVYIITRTDVLAANVSPRTAKDLDESDFGSAVISGSTVSGFAYVDIDKEDATAIYIIIIDM
ncbi:MAG: S-layer homology domain-containing protein [Oscillospiraceae bacterium]|nr:S-layer homology domain-containing protein [Oscillospiraceae bacterium]